MRDGYQKYKQTSIKSASREKLLLMLYEGAIRFTKLAKIAIEEKRVADKGIYIGRAYDIILELNNTLDHQVGGEISKNLEQLYLFITEQYTRANIHNDTKCLDNAIRILETLYEGWMKAVEALKSKNLEGGE